MAIEPISFALLLSAAVGRIGEMVVEKAAAAHGPLKERGAAARHRLEGLLPAESVRIVVEVVEQARKEVLRDRWVSDEAASRDLVTLLDHPGFAQDVVHKLLLRGTPDFDRLRRFYLEGEGDSDRWEALKLGLQMFFDGIETRLLASEPFGPLLRDTRQLVALTGIEDGQQELIRLSRQQQALAARAAVTGETHLTVALEQTTHLLEQTTHLSEIAALLRQQLEQQQATQAADVPSGPVLTDAERIYLRQLRSECDRLPLAGEARDLEAGSGRGRASLARVYVELETQTPPSEAKILGRLGVPEDQWPGLLKQSKGGKEGLHALLGVHQIEDDHPLKPWVKDRQELQRAARNLSAVDALVEHHHLVLLGDPGSGKSTFVNHLAAALADRLLVAEGDDEVLPLGDVLGLEGEETLFPVRVILRQWSSNLDAEAEGSADPLPQIYAQFQRLPGQISEERWKERLEDPHTLLLLDGLDEVPAASHGELMDRRRHILRVVAALRTAHPRCRLLVTCRVRPYRDPQYQLPQVPVFTLAELDDARIDRFTRGWYRELVEVGLLQPAELELPRGDRLLHAIGERPVLRQMAGTPLLLTMLARVNARSELPESRAELYGECTEQLLWSWEKAKSEDGGEVEGLYRLLEEAGTEKRADIERELWTFSYEMHATCGLDATAELPAAELEQRLARIHPDPEFQGKAWAAKVVDLMRRRGGLLVETSPGVFTFPHRSFQEYLAARRLLLEGNLSTKAAELAAGDVWWEVIELACGHLIAESDFERVQGMVHELVFGDSAEPGRLLLAGRIWRHFTPQRATGVTGKALVEAIPERLTVLLQDREQTPRRRLEAGEIVANLGVLPDDLDAWVEIPDDADLGYGFRIAKYPVTNAQYQRFVDAGGYSIDAAWWTAEARKEIQEWEGGKWPSSPRLWGNPHFDRPTLPVVGVSWYEALAYCAWLTGQLRAEGKIGADEEVRLPQEAEWMRVAAGRGGKRTYPWSKKFDAARINSEESGLGRPTPVHMYPAGASPEGVCDLCGNVWEWVMDAHRA